MCVLALGWAAHPRWSLILAGNRDEFHARPAAPLAHWTDRPGLIAGRDLMAGGTWLGVSQAGRLAVVTNLRGFGGPVAGMASRGALVTDLLAGDGAFADAQGADLASFNPFNLLLAEGAGLHFLTNRPAPVRAALGPGVYGLSNGALDAPWPKTVQLKAALLDWIVEDRDEPEALFAALAQERLPAFGVLPTAPSDVPEEAAASPIFIRNPVYGTRCSTVVAVDRAGKGVIIERRFGADAAAHGETRLAFDWPGGAAGR